MTQFILNVIRIFFRNKWSEIKKFFSYSNSKWTDLLELLITLGIMLVVITLLFGVVYGTGYLLMELGWVDVIYDGDEAPYAAVGVGIFFYVGVFIMMIIGYGYYQFFQWIWINIKKAIAEAKELQ